MQEQIDPIGVTGHLFEERSNLRITGHIAGDSGDALAKRAGQLLDVFFESVALIIKNQPRPGLVPGLGNGPGNTAAVCDTKNKTNFTGERFFTHRPVIQTGLSAGSQSETLSLGNSLQRINARKKFYHNCHYAHINLAFGKMEA